MDITNDDQKAFSFAPTYGYGSTAFHCNMISIVVFSYSNTIQSMFVDYAVIEMVLFDEYLDAAPRAKKIRGNGITNFPLQFYQCITFNQTKFVTATLIVETSLKSLYSSLGFNIIKAFATSPNFEKSCKRFHYESGKSEALQKKELAYNVI